VRQLAAAFLRRKLASGNGSSKLEPQKRQQAAALQTSNRRNIKTDRKTLIYKHVA